MRRAVLVVPAAAVLLAACSSSSKHYPAASPLAIRLSSSVKLAQPLVIGVVHSQHGTDAEGAGDYGLAQGAIAAAFRFGASTVKLQAVSDLGTDKGAQDAVAQLKSEGAVAIVYASEGQHLAAGLAAASSAGLCSLLPYATTLPAEVAPSTAWLTGPTQDQLMSSLSTAVTSLQLTDPVIIADGGVPAALRSALPNSVEKDITDPSTLTKADVKAVTAASGVVVWGPPTFSAQVTERLQALRAPGAVAPPVVFGPSALSSDFAGSLSETQGSTGTVTVAGEYLSEGLATTGDALRTGGFDAALQQAGTDESVKSLDPGTAFSVEGVTTGDTRSHDAVVALVRAAGRAAHPDAAGICAALKTLKLTSADGLAGPSLDLSAAAPLDATAVQVLQSDPAQGVQFPGARFQLGWFARPTAAASS